MTAPEYRIATIADFLAVPAEKQAECLRDFASWLGMARQHAEVEASLVALLGASGITFSLDHFTWIDDGVDGVSRIDFKDPDGERIARLSVLPAAEGGAQ